MAFVVACALVAGVGVTLGWLLRAARLVVEVRGGAVAVRSVPSDAGGLRGEPDPSLRRVIDFSEALPC